MFPSLPCGPVHLRAFQRKDLPLFTAYRANPDVARYQSWTDFTENDALCLYESMQEQPFGTPGRWFQLAIASNKTDTLLGDLAVHFIDLEQVEIGCTMDPAHQKKGLTTLALRRLLGYLFETMDKHRVVATTDVENHAAYRVLEKAGFRREAHYIDNIFFKGAWGSEYVYAILASEWTTSN